LNKLEEGRHENASVSSQSSAPVLADRAKVCRADDFEVSKVYSRSNDFEARVDEYEVMM